MLGRASETVSSQRGNARVNCCHGSVVNVGVIVVSDGRKRTAHGLEEDCGMSRLKVCNGGKLRRIAIQSILVGVGKQSSGSREVRDSSTTEGHGPFCSNHLYVVSKGRSRFSALQRRSSIKCSRSIVSSSLYLVSILSHTHLVHDSSLRGGRCGRVSVYAFNLLLHTIN